MGPTNETSMPANASDNIVLPPLSPSNLDHDSFVALLNAAGDGMFLIDAEQRCRYANPAARAIAGCESCALSRCRLTDHFAEPDRAPLLAQLANANPVERGHRAAIIIRPDGEQRDVEYLTLAVRVSDAPMSLIVLRDVTEARRMLRWASALAQIAASVATGTLESTLSTLARVLVRTSGTVACSVVLVDDLSQRTFRAAATYGLPDGYIAGMEEMWRNDVWLPAIDAIQRRAPVVYLEARREILNDPHCQPIQRFAQDAAWDSLAAVPLITRGRAVGALTGYYHKRPGPTESDVAFLSSIADQAAVAVENARLMVEAQGKAALEERQKLARELHDSVSQALYGIALGARTARELLARDPPQATKPIDYVLSLAEAGLAEMRALIFELRPESLANEGLVAALAKQAAAMRARHGLTVETAFCDEPEASLAVKEALYRIAQEAMQNTMRHARASRIDLRLTQIAGCDTADGQPSLELQIADNGVGFDTGGAFPGHLGLRSMHERAASIGGKLTISSVQGSGVSIQVRIPLAQRS